MPSIQTSVVLRKQLKPQSSFTSIVFKRSADDISKTPPSGGSFASPVPAGWSDGIPAGDNSEAAVWMSMRVFTSDGKSPQTPKWTNPVKMVDTQEWDYAYSSQASPKPDPPAADGNTIQNKDPWHNDPKDGDIWMAMRRRRNDLWGAWSVVRIKGEKGDQGEKGEDADFHTIEAQSQSYRSDSKYECYVKWDGKVVLNATTTGIWGVFLNAKTGAVTETIQANHYTDNGKTQAVKDFFLRIYAHYAKAKEEILCMVVVNAGFYATDWPTEGGSVEGNLRWNLQTYWGAGQDLDFKLPATNVSGRHAFVFIGQGGVGEDIPIWEKTYISTETATAIPQVTINKVGYVSGGKLTAPKKGDKGDNAADTLEVSSQSYDSTTTFANCFIKWNGQKLSGLTMGAAALYVVYINPNTGTLANVSAPIREIPTYGQAGNLEKQVSNLTSEWRGLPVGTIVAILSRDYTDFTQSTNFRKYLGWLGAPADLTLPTGGRVGFAFIAQKSVLTASADGLFKNIQTSICAVYATKAAGGNVVASVSANFAAGHMLSGGQKGDKGDKGDQGAQGLDGAIHRVTEWAVGKSYNDGTKLEGNYRYLDIVTYENNAYQCIKAIDNSQRPPDQLVGSYWSLIQAMKPINTPLILADNAILKFASSQQLLLRKDNQTYAGLAAGVTYPLWVGGTDGAAAPFRVSTDGKLTATGATIGGLTYRQATEVTSDNIGSFYTEENDYKETGSTSTTTIQAANVLKMGNWVNFTGGAITQKLYFPSRVSNGSTVEKLNVARALVGQTIMLYNVTTAAVQLAGVTTPNGGTTTLDKPFSLPRGYMAEITCKISRSSGGWETIGWYVTLLCPYSKEADEDVTTKKLTATFAYPSEIKSTVQTGNTGGILGGNFVIQNVQISAHVTDEYGFPWTDAQLTLTAFNNLPDSITILGDKATATTDSNGDALFTAILQYPTKSSAIGGTIESKTFIGVVKYVAGKTNINGQTQQIVGTFDNGISIKWTVTYTPGLAS